MRLAKEVESEVKSDVRAAKKIRLPWWTILSLIVVSTLTAWLFDHFGRLELGLPALNCIAIFCFAVAVKWKLRWRVWFWITMTILAALHVLLILFVPWTTKWVPALTIAGIDSADLIVMFVIISVVEVIVERPKTAASARRG